ncbi:helix-turn-helix domain-containing protein [Mucilaginibacter myungsuensis]|uniref:AraC family transcriptional regulator n=1 Tax=Mucilaginibacter myungsuensis TaxID=649104 RepID=A0A929L216_9SPHI|nr:helix-turn-helix domain-containing protein [Mucilaginibacter myungsuensis]MBE9661801.1 AraC family transcriptional regulator [Mucilaginibacter myungsuensis]MDN3599765.1 helix-turn-helix domain-containing protein [Mucilaginibacter myungsuensis]
MEILTSSVLINFNIVVAILVVVISQSLFTSGILWFSSQNKLSNRLLAVLLFAIALWLVDDFMRASGIYRQHPQLYFMPLFYSLGFGPLIYFYLLSLTNHKFKLQPKYLLHFIPVMLQAGLYFFLCFTSYPFKNWYWTNIHGPYTYRLEFDGTWVSLIVYLVLSFRLLQKYQDWVVNNFSEVSRIRLQWLKIILAILLVLSVQWMIEVVLRDGANSYFDYNYSVEILGVVALVLGVFGWRQANLSDISYEQTRDETPSPALPLFEADPLVLKQIQQVITDQKLYLDPTLTLVQLAGAVKLNPKVVSRNINAGLNKSFNDLINQYRVDEVKQRLRSADVEKLTIMGIAYESGFNSKTTFNRIFKQFTGSAPSDFMN